MTHRQHHAWHRDSLTLLLHLLHLPALLLTLRHCRPSYPSARQHRWLHQRALMAVLRVPPQRCAPRSAVRRHLMYAAALPTAAAVVVDAQPVLPPNDLVSQQVAPAKSSMGSRCAQAQSPFCIEHT